MASRYRNIFVPIDASLGSECPHCNEKNKLQQSSPKNVKDRFIYRFTPYRRYTCSKCRNRTFIYSYKLNPEWYKIAFFYLFIMLAGSFVIYTAIKKLLR